MVGKLKIIANIEKPQLIAKILLHREGTLVEQSQSEQPLAASGAAGKVHTAAGR